MKKIIFLLIFIPFIQLSAQQQDTAKYTITGKVVDESGKGIIGTTVRIVGQNIGTIVKDKAGFFTIENVPEGTQIVTARFVGFEPVTIETNITSDTILNFQLVKSEWLFEMEKEENDRAIKEYLLGSGVFVTANKKAEQVQDVPISIATINKSTLGSRGITRLDDALEYVPGVEINQDNVSIRGSSGFSFGIGSRVALLIDGFPLLAGDNGDIKFDALPMFNIERVEIVKGAGSALYGTGALGGVINLITEIPSSSREFKIRAFSGFYTQPRHEQWKYTDDYRLNNGVNASFGMTGNNFNLITSGSLYEDQGYRFYDDRFRWNFFTKGRYFFTDKIYMSIIGNAALEEKADWVYWNSLDSATIPPTGTNTDIRIESYKYSLFGDFNWIMNRNTFMNFKAGFFLTDYQNTLPENNEEFRQSEALAFNSELQFNSYLSEKFFLTYGLNMSATDVTSFTYGNQSQAIYSAYAQVEYTGIDHLILTAGTRADHEEVPELESHSEISPKLGLSYKLTGDINLRASIGKGFRTPNVAERFSTVAFQGFDVIPNPELKPEKSWSYEFGGNYRFELGETVWSADASVFRNDLIDLIEPNFTGTGAEITFENLTEARIQGVELNLKSMLLKNLGFETSLTFMDPKNTATDEVLKYRSEWLWYNSVFIPWKFMELQLDYRYKSKVERVDRELALVVRNIDARVDVHIVDARLMFELEEIWDIPLKVTLRAENLLDYYYTELVGNLGRTRLISLQLDAVIR